MSFLRVGVWPQKRLLEEVVHAQPEQQVVPHLLTPHALLGQGLLGLAAEGLQGLHRQGGAEDGEPLPAGGFLLLLLPLGLEPGCPDFR